jgi:arylsulfatase A-like enzyme
MERKTIRTLFFAAAAACAAAAQTAAERPNILWLTCEDSNITWIGCYGNPHAETPSIDRLAKEGFQYMHAYANAPVCAPSRSTWITGMLAISNGTFPMRSRNEIPHDRIRYYPDYLRANGYYTGNDNKTDYNIGGRPDQACWDNPGGIKWAELKHNQPFFQVVNFFESHESRAQGDVENTFHDPADTRLRAYHPDLPDVRKNYAKYHDAVKRMDADIGKTLKKLKESGLAENTIVIFNSDHGGVLPRSKRYLFESGIHCPLIIRIPEKFRPLWPAERPGMKIDRMVSFVDMPKTWLSLTGSEVPAHLHGTVFLGAHTEAEQDYHFAFRGRMDERIENARAVRDKQYLYIRNYMPYIPWMQHLNYLWKMKATQRWDEHVRSGRATEVQARFFKPKGWTEELYDVRKDPDNIHNLIENPEYRQVANRMRKALRENQEQFIDAGLLPESEMIRRAADHNLTIHDMVRDSGLYPLDKLIDAADLALEEDPANLLRLRKLIKNPDSGLRYWGVVGCFLLNDREAALSCIDDDSHEVRAMAAWLLIKTGSKDQGLKCLDNLLKQESYATLTVLNMVEWLGDDGHALMPTVRSLEPAAKSYEERMKNSLVEADANLDNSL